MICNTNGRAWNSPADLSVKIVDGKTEAADADKGTGKRQSVFYG